MEQTTVGGLRTAQLATLAEQADIRCGSHSRVLCTLHRQHVIAFPVSPSRSLLAHADITKAFPGGKKVGKAAVSFLTSS